MTQVTPEQMNHAWGVLFVAIFFLMAAVPFVVEKKFGKLAAVLALLPGAFCFVLWAVAAARFILGAA